MKTSDARMPHSNAKSSGPCTCPRRVRCLSFSTRTRTDSSCTGPQGVGRWRTSWPTSTESLRAGRREGCSMPNRLTKESSAAARDGESHG